MLADEDTRLNEIFADTGTNPMDWLASTGFFEQSRTQVPSMDSAEMKKLTSIVNSGKADHLIIEDAKTYFNKLYKQDPKGGSEFFINFLRAQHRGEFGAKDFKLLQAAGYSSLYEAGNCAKGCDFSAMGMELTQDDVLAGIRSGSVNINSIQDMSSAWGVDVDGSGNASSVGIIKEEFDFSGDTLGVASHNGLFDHNRYAYEHEGETYILVPSPILGGMNTGYTVSNPPEVVIRLKPAVGGKIEAHEDFHYHQMVSLFENMVDDNGVFDTDNCMGDAKCKGSLLTMSNIERPVLSGKYSSDYPDNFKANEYIFGGYQHSIMEYPAWGIMKHINKPTYDGGVKY